MSAWRVTQIKAECGVGREIEREPRADERGRDQVRDKRYEIYVAEGARQMEKSDREQQKRGSPPILT